MEDLLYVCLVVNQADLANNGVKPAWEWQKSLHVTLSFVGRDAEKKARIVETFKPLFGKKVPVRITGEGVYKNENQGLLVEILDEEVAALCENTIPHITVSINKAAGAKAVNTRYITCDVKHDFIINGTVMWADAQNNHHI